MITDSDIWLELERVANFDSGVVHVKFIDRDCSEPIDTYICLVYKDDKDHPGTLVTQRNFDIIRHNIDVMEDVNITKLYIREGPKINIAQPTTKEKESGVIYAPYIPVDTHNYNSVLHIDKKYIKKNIDDQWYQTLKSGEN